MRHPDLAYTFVHVCEHCGETYEADGAYSLFCSFDCQVWSKVRVLGEDECWPWTGPLDAERGWGQVGSYKLTKTHVPWRSYRATFWLTQGRHPEAAIHHECGDKSCCNPRHMLEAADECIFPGCEYPREAHRGRRHKSYCAAHQKHVIRYGAPRAIKWRNRSAAEAWAKYWQTLDAAGSETP